MAQLPSELVPKRARSGRKIRKRHESLLIASLRYRSTRRNDTRVFNLSNKFIAVRTRRARHLNPALTPEVNNVANSGDQHFQLRCDTRSWSRQTLKPFHHLDQRLSEMRCH